MTCSNVALSDFSKVHGNIFTNLSTCHSHCLAKVTFRTSSKYYYGYNYLRLYVCRHSHFGILLVGLYYEFDLSPPSLHRETEHSSESMGRLPCQCRICQLENFLFTWDVLQVLVITPGGDAFCLMFHIIYSLKVSVMVLFDIFIFLSRAFEHCHICCYLFLSCWLKLPQVCFTSCYNTCIGQYFEVSKDLSLGTLFFGSVGFVEPFVGFVGVIT